MQPLEGLRVLTLEQFGAGPYGTHVPRRPRRRGHQDRERRSRRRHRPARRALTCSATTTASISRPGAPTRRAFRSTSSREATRRCCGGWSRPRMRSSTTCAATSPQKLRPRLHQPQVESIPRIVCLHISAYGRDNERKAWPGYDFLMQAEAGLMSLTGEPDGPPTGSARP